MKQKLRIAQVAPLWESVPPPKYGGTERVVHSLTEYLVGRGHDVTLFACGTSKTSAKLSSVYPRPLFRDGIPWTNIMYPMLNITEAFDRHNEFDILHMHLNKSSDYLALPLARQIKEKVVFTLHFPYPGSQPGREDREAILQKYRNYNYVSISDSQRKGGENLNWVGTVYNGIDLLPYSFHPEHENYFVWLGKFNPDKGTKEAIEVALKTKTKIKLAGKVDTLAKEDYAYFKKSVEPYLSHELVEFVGEVGNKEKNELFGNAKAFLNPICWNEPFGLVMTESMATGTPVISFRAGAAPEIIEDGETGFIVDTFEEMVRKTQEIDTIDRRKCRQVVEERFSADIMSQAYERIFYSLVS